MRFGSASTRRSAASERNPSKTQTTIPSPKNQTTTPSGSRLPSVTSPTSKTSQNSVFISSAAVPVQVPSSPNLDSSSSASRSSTARPADRKPGQRAALKGVGSGVVSTPRSGLANQSVVSTEATGQSSNTGPQSLQPCLSSLPSAKERSDEEGERSKLANSRSTTVASPPLATGSVSKAMATSPTSPQGLMEAKETCTPAVDIPGQVNDALLPLEAHGGVLENNTSKSPTLPKVGGTMSASSGVTCRDDDLAGGRIIMRMYVMYMSDDDVMGEGTSSICRKGKILHTGEPVAIKVYKSKKKKKGKSREADQFEEVTMKKFKRQIAVLKELQKPLVKPQDASLWNEQLASTTPSKLFMQLLDYSTGIDGEPGPDPDDGVMYVVTEIAQYSLKDYIKHRRDQSKPLSKEAVRSLTKAIVLVTAGLHAKGLVHLDLKPENLMMFNGCLKLIDVDGCVKIGTTVVTSDSSLSFSPCYCAPEWASFLIQDLDEPSIIVFPSLDVWSIGMTICELVTFDAALKHTYASFVKNGRSYREAGFYFMDWLSSLEEAPLPRQIEEFDKNLMLFLTHCLLICNPAQRLSLARSLKHPYINHAGVKKHTSDEHRSNEGVERHRRRRSEDHSDKYLHKGMMWKLNWNGNPKDTSHWLKRDMWIANNGSICYFSLKENKRLVLVDAHHLSSSVITRFEGGAKEPAFIVKTKLENDDDDDADPVIFACDSENDYDVWINVLEDSKAEMLSTMKMGFDLAQELRDFRLFVRNRRKDITGEIGYQDKFAAIFKGMLWKLKANGDMTKDSDWFQRNMWLSKNGSLVYWSAKEEKELIYFSHSDIENASLEKISKGASCKTWAFQVQLSPVNGLEFMPSAFAAESEEMRDLWIHEFEKFCNPCDQ